MIQASLKAFGNHVVPTPAVRLAGSGTNQMLQIENEAKINKE